MPRPPETGPKPASVRSSRRLLFPLPREHGSWVLLLGPVALAWIAYGSANLRLLLFLVCLIALFLAREPLACLVRQRQKSPPSPKKAYWWRWFSMYSALAVLTGLPVLLAWELWDLLPLAAGAIIILGIHLSWVGRKDERNLAAEWLGVAGLCLTGVATDVVQSGRLTPESFLLWVLCVLFFSSGLLHVRMRIGRALGKNSRPAITRSVVYHLFLAGIIVAALFAGRISIWVGVAFTPILVRAFLPFLSETQTRLNLKRIGYLEVIYAVIFAVTCGLALRFGH